MTVTGLTPGEGPAQGAVARRSREERFWYPYLLIAPTMFTLVVVGLVPFIFAVVIREYSGGDPLDGLVGREVRVRGLFGSDQELGVYIDASYIGPVAAFKIATVVKRLPKTRSGKILRGTMRAIADGEDYKAPATIDDPAILGEIADSLKGIGYPKEA